jgi:5-methylcytosine-specific restriction endonuclease McrA
MGRNSRRNIRLYVYERDRGICWLCGKPVAWVDYTMDHVVPRSYGAPHLHRPNLRCSHEKCNKERGNKLDGYDLTQVPSPLYTRIRDCPGLSR